MELLVWSVLYFALGNLFVIENTALLFHNSSNTQSPDGGIDKTTASLVNIVAGLEQDRRELNAKFAKLENTVNQQMNEMNSLKNGLKRQLNQQVNETNALKNENKGLKSQLLLNTEMINKMQKKLSALTQDVADIKKSQNETQERNEQKMLNDFRANISTLSTELRYISLSISDVHKEISGMNKSVAQAINSNFKDQQLMQENINHTITQLIHEERQKIAFTAGVTNSNSGWSGSTLIFSHLVYSVGGGYDTSTGIFTSPQSGEFVFYVAIESYDTRSINLRIVLNGAGKVESQGYSGSFAASSNLVVIHLEKGDRVWVVRSEGTGYYTRTCPLTTFSGFML